MIGVFRVQKGGGNLPVDIVILDGDAASHCVIGEQNIWDLQNNRTVEETAKPNVAHLVDRAEPRQTSLLKEYC